MPLAALRLILAALFLALAPASAQAPDAPDKKLDQVRLQLDQIQASLQRADQSDAALKTLRAQLDPLNQTIQGVIAELSPRLEAIRQRLDQLKPKAADKAAPAPVKPPAGAAAPAKPDAVPDAADSETADQEKAFADVDATLRRARSLAVETEQTIGAVQERRRTLFTRALFEQSAGLLNPSLWAEVAHELPRDAKAIEVMGGDWLSVIFSRLTEWRLPLAAGLFALLLTVVWPTIRATRRVMLRHLPTGEQARLRKVMAALVIALTIFAIPFGFVVLGAALTEAFDLANPRLQPFFRVLSEGVLRVAAAAAVSRALFNPARGQWRLINVSDQTARHVCVLVLRVAALVSLFKLVGALADVIAAALPMVVAIRGIGAVAVALTIAQGLRRLGGPPADEECLGPRVAQASDLFGPARLAMWAALATIVAAALIGYVAFASFLADQFVWIVSLAAVLYLLVAVVEEGFSAAFQPQSSLGRALMGSVGLRKEALQQIAILLTGAAHLALYTMAALLALAPWGLQSDDLAVSLRAAFFGFQVGDVTISPSNILVALLLFAIALGVTRAMQSWLDVRFLPLTQLDRGLRNSIRTSLGYLGFVLAFALALAHLGLSFEKLAIVAGALSVGIGFGLQSIVNNFVSGLILLWERAIRVGDWIVVGDDQGYVRRINVRSTEIETFDRLTVIVPNSSLVSGVVKNWVRGDRIGRVRIEMVLPNDTDMDRVRDLLISIAKSHGSVLKIPSPSIFFSSIGAMTSTIDLYCFVEDVETSARVRSDLLFEIHKRFKAAGLIGPVIPSVAVNLNGLELSARAAT